MIKNIVFDLGRVLIDFNPEAFLGRFNHQKEVSERLLKVIFKNELWVELDRGTLEEEEATELFCKEEPTLTAEIKEVMANWKDMLLPKEDTVRILKELKRAGYKLYVLSNYHRNAYKETKEKNSFFQLFDGEIVSYALKTVKPEREIYQALIDSYSLIPEETLFIDDSIENIMAAKKLSIKAIHFHDADSLRRELERFNVII